MSGTLTCTGLSPPMVDLSRSFQFMYFNNVEVLQPHIRRNEYGLGSCAFARHYLRNH
jgi:hypothetical protein